MAQPIVVSDKTSLVLASTLNTVYLLSNVSSVGHIVTVQDITNSINLQTQPFVVSTIGGVKFYDGTSSILLNKPGGSLSLSTRDSNTWQLLNNQGFPTTLDRAFLNTLTNTYSYLDRMSTGVANVSTLSAYSLQATGSVTIGGQTIFKGNTTIEGVVTAFSSLTVSGNTVLHGALYVQEASQLLSSVRVSDAVTFYSNVSTLGDVFVEGSLSVGSSLTAKGAVGLNVFQSTINPNTFNPLYLAAGDSNFSIAYSQDGTSFTTSPSGQIPLSNTFAIAWNGSLWVAVGSGIAYSSDGLTWSSASDGSSVSYPLRCLAYYGGNWIAAGTYGAPNDLGFSANGTNWAGCNSGFNMFGYGIDVNPTTGTWTIVGQHSGGDAILLTSPDSVTWTSNTISYAGTSNLFAVKYSATADKWVASGQIGGDLTSTDDGSTWSFNPLGIPIDPVRSITYTTNRWVATGGSTNTIAHSLDGTTWTGLGSLIFGSGGEGKSLTYNNNLVVVTGQGTNQVGYSSDGLTWTPSATNPFFATTSAVASRPSQANTISTISGVGGIYPLGNVTIQTLEVLDKGASAFISGGMIVSDNFSTLSSLTVLQSTFVGNLQVSTINLSNITANYIAVGNTSDTYAISPTGTGFTTNTGIGLDTGYAIGWNGSLWVAGGSNTAPISNIRYSYDGLSWSNGNVTGFTPTTVGVAWNGTSWIAIGGTSANEMARSTDGINWTGFTSGCNNTPLAIAANASVWVVVGADSLGAPQILTSPDGTTWTSKSFTPAYTFPLTAVKNVGTQWIASGFIRGDVLSYDNAATWAFNFTLPIPMNIVYGITYGNSTWVAVGNPAADNAFDASSNIAYSTDLSGWVGLGSNFFGTGNGRAVTFQNGLFVATGDNSKIAYSTDGINWTETTSGAFTTSFGIGSRTPPGSFVSSIGTAVAFTSTLITSTLLASSILSAEGNASFEFLSSLSNVTIGGDLSIRGALTVENYSSLSTFFIGGNISTNTTIVDKSAFVSQSSIVNSNLRVFDTASFSSLISRSILSVSTGNVYVSDSAFVSSLSTQGSFFVGSNLVVTGITSSFGALSTLSSIEVQNSVSKLTLSTFQSTFIGGNLSNSQIQVGGFFSTGGTFNIVGNMTVSQNLNVGGSLGTAKSITTSNTQTISTLEVYANLISQQLVISTLFTSTVFMRQEPKIQISDTPTPTSYQVDIEGTLGQTILSLSSLSSVSARASNVDLLNMFVGPAPTGFVDQLFVVSTPAVFTSTVYVSQLSSHQIYASSIFGNLAGDGSQLSNLDKLKSTMTTSTLRVSTLIAGFGDIQNWNTEKVNVTDQIATGVNSFFSSQNLFVAVGLTNNVSSMIQYSFNPTAEYASSSNSFFSNGANSVANSGNPLAPFFVAVGSNADPLYTIQWSSNASNWNPITSGGFTGEGTKVVYANGVWTACGEDTVNNSNRVQYSLDGSNWLPATFTGDITPNQTYTLNYGSNEWFYTGVKNNPIKNIAWKSTDGITFTSNTEIFESNTCVAYGKFLGDDAWLFFHVGVSNFFPISFNFTKVVPYINNVYETAIQFNIGLLSRLRDAVFANNLWVATGATCNAGQSNFGSPNTILFSPNGSNWSNSVSGGFEGLLEGGFGLNYNPTIPLWTAVGQVKLASNTIQTSSDGSNWTGLSGTGGFQTGVAEYGFASAISPQVGGGVIAVGYNATSNGSNIQLAAATNSNFFAVSSISFGTKPVYGIDRTNAVMVAVGEGSPETRTIGFSVDLGSNFYPVIIGGFESAGRGVTATGTDPSKDYFLAVGDAPTNTLNTIQYSVTGINWIGVNDGTGVQQGGYGVVTDRHGNFLASTQALVFGQDSNSNANIVTSYHNSSNWSNYPGSTFSIRARAGAVGESGSQKVLIVAGEDADGNHTLLRTNTTTNVDPFTNPLSNIPGTFTGFSGGAFGVAACNAYSSDFVAVGFDTDMNKTIKFSSDGGCNWTDCATAGMAPISIRGAYGVRFVGGSPSLWFVAAESSQSRYTILTSVNPLSGWSDTLIGGFESKSIFGTGRAVTSQLATQPEILPYLQMPYLTVRQRALDRPFFDDYNNQILLQTSTFLVNRLLYVNSNYVGVNYSNANTTPYALIADPYIYASTFHFRSEYILNTFYTDLTQVSSLVQNSLDWNPYISHNNLDNPYSQLKNLYTPYVSIKTDDLNLFPSSNFIRFTESNTHINTTLFANLSNRNIGILCNSPRFDLDVRGSLYSDFINVNLMNSASSIQISSAVSTVVQMCNFAIVQGQTTAPRNINTLLTLSNNIILNNILTMTPVRLGFSTLNPSIQLDVQASAYISTLSTGTLETGGIRFGFQTF